ncbi:MAG: hypothetical protein CM1200mP30_33770 [Pseudomonadota bacterium]|nr:MAG: hypothetical protein CM1200mP30_33770 [Pseudomonadota bacterium]
MASYLSLTIHLLFDLDWFLSCPQFLHPDQAWLLTPMAAYKQKIFLGCDIHRAAVLTPPDVFTQTLMAGPLIILYEISILVSQMAGPIQKNLNLQYQKFRNSSLKSELHLLIFKFKSSRKFLQRRKDKVPPFPYQCSMSVSSFREQTLISASSGHEKLPLGST